MGNFEMDLIHDIFKQYNIVYDRERKVISVNSPISVDNFIYLKRVLKMTSLDIHDIVIGGVKL